MSKASDGSMSDDVSLESLTVNQLKAMLDEKGLPKSGKKADLIERLNATNEEKIIDYLAKNYGPVSKGRRQNLQNVDWYELQ